MSRIPKANFFEKMVEMGEEAAIVAGTGVLGTLGLAAKGYVDEALLGGRFDLEAVVPAVARKLGGATLSSQAKAAHVNVGSRSLFLFKFDDTLSVVVPTFLTFRRGCIPEGLSNELLTRGLLYGEWKYSPHEGRLRLECHANLPVANLTADAVASVANSLIQAVNGLEAEAARR